MHFGCEVPGIPLACIAHVRCSIIRQWPDTAESSKMEDDLTLCASKVMPTVLPVHVQELKANGVYAYNPAP